MTRNGNPSAAAKADTDPDNYFPSKRIIAPRPDAYPSDSNRTSPKMTRNGNPSAAAKADIDPDNYFPSKRIIAPHPDAYPSDSNRTIAKMLEKDNLNRPPRKRRRSLGDTGLVVSVRRKGEVGYDGVRRLIYVAIRWDPRSGHQMARSAAATLAKALEGIATAEIP